MEWFKENFWLIMFVIWGLPLGWFRSKFRKMVYQTDQWIINIKPVFGKEIKALFGNIYPDDSNYIKTRNQYRIYLIIYTILFVIYQSGFQL